MITLSGHNNISSLTLTTQLNEEKLVRDKQTNATFIPLTSTIVLQCKEKMLYVLLDFVNKQTIDNLLDSGAHFTAIA